MKNLKMNMMNLELEKVLQLVVGWTKEVGKKQCVCFRGADLGIETKSNLSDVVTRVDKWSEAFLLKQIAHHFPDHSVLGEESGEHDHHSDYLWVVDPLDGTNNYSQGLPVFTISIALKYRGNCLLGVVYAPYLNELYTAIRGQGAYLNGTPIHVASKTSLRCGVFCTGFPYDKDVHPVNNADNLVRLLPLVRGIRRFGSAAYDLCSVAAGFLDGYWELGLKEWDVCAGICIVQEAGGVVRPFREDRGVAIIAGNATMVDLLKDYIQ